MSSDGAAAAADGKDAPEVLGHVQVDLMQLVFELEQPGSDKAALQARVLAQVEKAGMAPLYDSLCAKFGWPVDEALKEKMHTAMKEKLAAFDASIAAAKEHEGDVEVADRQREKAAYLGSVGDRAGAVAAYAAINQKHLSTGQKIDQVMALCRLAILESDWKEAKAQAAKAADLNEKGGDWDRRNRLKVYEGLLALVGRDFPRAAGLFLESVPTFTATDILSFESIIFYTCVAGLKALPRATLKKNVIDSPDVLAVVDEVHPRLQPMLAAFYGGRYQEFLEALVAVYPLIASNRFLAPHAGHYLREMRLAAYKQFLESYKSVTLAGMARAFGVSEAFLDGELSRFIAGGHITAKIDAVAGVVETTRPDAKNAQYAEVIKTGDVLLNKVQKLSRVLTV